ncbi:putative DNA polymerase I [Achromobacter phage vB_AxyP_19-32_Axy23]|uniref:Putative DNA polymerase I n=1 Tax=Achromobacter phage vB_AxyP_19-32_Axy23 TaxID=2591047 RepID=A0A514CW09_9CAUD|nr:putative DNA polymerase I [Achromobacter phage vB_AxyP_19-32_Axy23]
MTAPDHVMIFDLETGVRSWFGDKASPRHPENFVVMHGQCIEREPFTGEITGARYTGNADWLHIPDNVWLIVAHNATFEESWMLVRQRPELMKFLKRGGRIFCTAYAHYLLSNQADQYPALDVIAPMYGGTHKVDEVKLLWEQGWMTEDIDPALLSRYLLDPEEGDIANTRRVFWGQVKQLQERGMWDMALERMEGQLFNAFAMDSGLKVDRKFAFEERDRLEAELTKLKAAFAAHRSNFPEEAVFKETSDFHMSAWLFGGPLKYRARVLSFEADGVTPKWEKEDAYKFGETMVLVSALAESPQGMDAAFVACTQAYGAADRYSAGKNKGSPRVHKVPVRQATRWGELIYNCPGIVDLNLLPAQEREAFMEKYIGKRKLADDSPVISTGAEALEFLAKRRELPEHATDVIKSLLTFARLDKDIGTYYLREERDDDGNVVKQSGMLQYLTDQDIVHHVLNVTSTITGRLSSNRPNMQNLPRGDANVYHQSRVKEMFVSRFGDDGVIMEADYTALEVVTLAAFSQDVALIKALLDGTDMHCLRLSKKLNESYESVLEKCKNEDHPQHDEYKKMRTDIKPPSFAYQYGATAMGISFSTGMPIEEAEEFIANEKALFPGVEAFYDQTIIPTVMRSTRMAREQRDDGSWGMYGVGHWQAPGGTCYQFRQYEKKKWHDGERKVVMEYKPTQMRNYPVQGESGFFVQGIAGLIIRWLISKDFFGGLVHVINQVHDAIYLDCHKSVLPEVARTVKLIMESLPTYFSQKYGYNLNVPFPAAVEYGPNMGNKVAFKE